MGRVQNFVICLLTALPAICFAQNDRNQQVRSLNSIIGCMDESSRVNLQIYYDILSFSEAYFANLQKRNDNRWHVSVSAGARLKSGDLLQYKELHPDAAGYINDWEAKLLPFIRSKQELKERLAAFPVKNEAIVSGFSSFVIAFDNMLYKYKAMVDYVQQQAFKTDNDLRVAKRLIDDLQPWFERYDAAAKKLYRLIEDYYQSLPPLHTQAAVRAAQAELLLSTGLLEKWAQELYAGDDSHRRYNDSLLRVLYTAGKEKAAAYLGNTYGFNVPGNGAFPHARYKAFYGGMPSTIFWYGSDTTAYNKLLPKAYDKYNRLVNRYNSVIHSYNQFIDCADGQALARNMDYSIKMAAEVGADTAQYVLLKKPRIAYRFALVMEPEEAPPVVTSADTTDRRRLEQIRSADPHHTVYLLDVSNSMKEENKLDTLKEAMKYLVSLQRAADNISVIAFADNAETLLRFTSCDQKERIYKRIDRLKPNGGTNAGDAMRDGYRLIDSTQQYKGKTRMVIITDGLFDVDKPTRKKIEAYQRAGVHLSILLLGKYHEQETLDYFQSLCTRGNGRFYDLRQYSLKEALVEEAVN
ncbi:MAG: VWA domain-containing protein [Flavihumibacter sp.]